MKRLQILNENFSRVSINFNTQNGRTFKQLEQNCNCLRSVKKRICKKKETIKRTILLNYSQTIK